MAWFNTHCSESVEPQHEPLAAPAVEPAFEGPDDILVVAYKPRQASWKLLPAAVLIVVALGLLTLRAHTSDWRLEWPRLTWAWPRPAANPTPQGAAVPVQPPSVTAPAPAPKLAATPPAEAAAPKVESKPQDESAKVAALDEINREAERIRAEREELAKIKEEAGEQIAAAPRPRGIRRFDPAQAARQQLAMQRFMQDRLAEQEKRVADMMRRRRDFLANRGVPERQLDRQFDELDRAFRELRQEMDALQREAMGARVARRPDFGAIRGRIVPPPPMPDLGPANPDLEPGNIQRFDFVDPDGNRVSGFQIHFSND